MGSHRTASPDPRKTHAGGTTPTREVADRMVDDAGAQEHDAALYETQAVAPKIAGLEALTESHYAQYEAQGFVAVEGAFTLERVDAARRGLRRLLEADRPDPRTLELEARIAAEVQRLTPAQREGAVRKFMDFTCTDPNLHAMAHDPAMGAVVRRLLGGAEPEVLQEMALIKAPGGREKPWHQDRAYFDVPADAPVVGAWIALDDAACDNGCMRVLAGGHRDGPITHFQRRDWQICDTDILGRQPMAVPLRPGGLLLFDALLPHGTPHNPTNRPRWALQFHYSPRGTPRTDSATRLARFGAEGKDATC